VVAQAVAGLEEVAPAEEVPVVAGLEGVAPAEGAAQVVAEAVVPVVVGAAAESVMPQYGVSS
jgi:hypothetical protein